MKTKKRKTEEYNFKSDKNFALFIFLFVAKFIIRLLTKYKINTKKLSEFNFAY